MKKKQFKIGDRVQLTKAYCRWVVDHLVELYFTSDGVFRGEVFEISPMLGALQANDTPLVGTVAGLGEDEPGVPTVRAVFFNDYGNYPGWVRTSDVVKLKKKKANK